MNATDTRLQVKKIIKAKRNKVFAAWTQPELMKKWFAPGTMSVPSAQSDLRVGGNYQIEMKGSMDGEDTNPTVGGTYKEIIPNELLVFTWTWQHDPQAESLVTVEFKETTDGTEVTLTHDRFPNIEARNKHEQGWYGCLENLASRSPL